MDFMDLRLSKTLNIYTHTKHKNEEEKYILIIVWMVGLRKCGWQV